MMKIESDDGKTIERNIQLYQWIKQSDWEKLCYDLNRTHNERKSGYPFKVNGLEVTASHQKRSANWFITLEAKTKGLGCQMYHRFIPTEEAPRYTD
jgi:hypothetical protein